MRRRKIQTQEQKDRAEKRRAKKCEREIVNKVSMTLRGMEPAEWNVYTMGRYGDKPKVLRKVVGERPISPPGSMPYKDYGIFIPTGIPNSNKTEKSNERETKKDPG